MDDKIRQNTDKMYRVALAITHSKEDAQDAVQDAFLKMYEKRPGFHSPEHETAWLIRVTVNRCKNMLRFRKKTTELSDIYPAKTPEQSEIVEVVQSLPVKYRTVIHLHYFEGYSTKLIASITKQKESTVRMQLTRARELLRKYLTDDEEEKSI